MIQSGETLNIYEWFLEIFVANNSLALYCCPHHETYNARDKDMTCFTLPGPRLLIMGT